MKDVLDASYLLTAAAVQRARIDPHPELSDDPHFARDTWLCSWGERPPTVAVNQAQATCLACAISSAARATRDPFAPTNSASGGRMALWRSVQHTADRWAEKGHPAAVHMQRLADELELRYGGQP